MTVTGIRAKSKSAADTTLAMTSRMESHGAPDAIQITRSTWELVRDDFVTESSGLVDVKGKGEVETWRLVGPIR